MPRFTNSSSLVSMRPVRAVRPVPFSHCTTYCSNLPAPTPSLYLQPAFSVCKPFKSEVRSRPTSRITCPGARSIGASPSYKGTGEATIKTCTSSQATTPAHHPRILHSSLVLFLHRVFSSPCNCADRLDIHHGRQQGPGRGSQGDCQRTYADMDTDCITIHNSGSLKLSTYLICRTTGPELN
jgi:hypothetical protein